MKLFVIYIGGSHERGLIELHDMRFIIARNIEDTYEELKKSWWGIPESLHIDAWGALKYVDGYKINLANHPTSNTENKLFFVNLGGYDQNEFTELHKNIFIVAPNESKAKAKALKQILHWKGRHKDYSYEVENIMDLTNIGDSKNVYIHLSPSEISEPFEFTCKYLPLYIAKVSKV